MEPERHFGGFDDPESGIWTNLRPGLHSRATVLSFGGIVNGPITKSPFEFFKFFDELPYRKIFLRDLDQCWYQRGIRGLAPDLVSAVERLRPLVDQSDGPVITVGASAGGYAAMVFGTLLGADHCLAFSPQTNLTRAFRFLHRDARWGKQIRHMRRSPEVRHLRVQDMTRARTAIAVHYARGNRLDAAHAADLRSAHGVRLDPREGTGHNVVRKMRETGELAELMDRLASERA